LHTHRERENMPNSRALGNEIHRKGRKMKGGVSVGERAVRA
jgi:hypothetical protein